MAKRRFNPTTFDPIKSTKTKLVETRPDGLRIYAHTVDGVAGNFIVVNDANNWMAAADLAAARDIPKEHL